MTLGGPNSASLTVTAKNIGGIDQTEVSFSTGVTVLTGRNATNRTSFLQALMAAFGSEKPSLKGDADEGTVTLTIGGETYDRVLRRSDGTVLYDGDPYLEDPTAADRFAFLLGNNEARLAVERGDDLRDVIMQPVDTDAIEAEIERLTAEKRELRDELDRLSALSDELPELESRKNEIEEALASKRSKLQETQEEIDDRDLDVDEYRDQKEALESLFNDLQSEQSALEAVEFDLATERETIDELEAERDQLQEDLETIDDELGNSEDLTVRIDDLRERKRSLDSTLSELQSVVEFNEAAIEHGGPDLGDALEQNAESSHPDNSGAITDQLVKDRGDIVCWTCGTSVTADTIETTIEELRSVRADLVQDRNELQSEIDSLTEQRDSIAERKRERERAEQRIETIKDELEEARTRIEELEAEREATAEAVEELEEEIDAFEDTDYDEALEIHRTAKQLELEVEGLESDREDIEERIGDLRDEIDRRGKLETRREDLHEQLTDLRTRVETVEKDAVESFNDHMASILDALEYDNIERIWIERKAQKATAGTGSEATFDLHVVRAAEDGTTYRDSIDHLSESERTVTGLVFALAGFLVHDLADDLPILLLDSLEDIDSERIAKLIEYFETYVDYLVVVLLPEDAQTMSQEYEYVTQI